MNKNGQVLPFYINGAWRMGKGGRTFSVTSPSSQTIISEIALASKEDAVEACETAFENSEKMAKLTAEERGEILLKTAILLENSALDFASCITSESGKPISEAKGEVKAAIERLKFGAEEAHRLIGEAMKGDSAAGGGRKVGMVLRQPLGVILGITPFNYPLYIPVSKIAPAIAAGNCVIIKPASSDPTPMLMLAKLFEQAGLPGGVLQVVPGEGKEIGDVLVSHPRINMISFTGNTETGKRIARLAVLAKLHLELGGKSPALVFPPCNLDLAVSESVKGAFKYSGQRCDAISRVLVQESLYSQFLEKTVEEAKKWIVGDPFDEKTQIGPLINNEAMTKVTGLVEDARSKGAKVLLGGGPLKGLYFAPTVLSEVTSQMRIAWEETFGPVVTIMKVKDYNEALELSNKSEFGLDASVFTTDINLALDAGMKLSSGTVQINGAPAHGVGVFPYGGNEASGLGREGLFLSAEEMTKIHTIVFNPE